jgi:SAM-dependent methyltransferase
VGQRHKQDWEELAAHDPLWAVLSAPGRRGGRWDPGEFFATGEADVEAALSLSDELGRPALRRRVLDFGCGVGRLARPFAARFDEYVGLDFAETMVARARALHRDVQDCTFVVHAKPDLRLFGDAQFDLVYSNLVLQHQPSKAAVWGYLSEFLRVVRPDGLVVFQLPTALAFGRRLQPRRRVYALLRRLGVGVSFLQTTLALHPIRLIGVPEDEVRTQLESSGGEILRIATEHADGIAGRRYYVIPAPL